jgi:hypothetical protein
MSRTIRESTYLLLNLPVGAIGFSVMVTGIATGASLAITLVGIPILAGALLLARHAAGLERARARTLLGVELAEPPARDDTGSFARRLLSPLRDRAAWKAGSYFLLMLPAGVATFSATVAWWATALFLLTQPAWAWALPHGGPQVTDTDWWSAPWELAASATVGLALLALTPFVIHALTGADRRLLHLLGEHQRQH